MPLVSFISHPIHKYITCVVAARRVSEHCLLYCAKKSRDKDSDNTGLIGNVRETPGVLV